MTASLILQTLTGDVLQGMRLDGYSVELEFAGANLQLFTAFSLVGNDDSEASFRPEQRSGDAAALWALIGQKITDVAWADTIVLSFGGGAQLSIPPADDGPRGTIKDKKSMAFADF